MTYKVTLTTGMRLTEIYSGPSSKYASLVYDAAIETARFTGATVQVQNRYEQKRVPTCIATTLVDAGRSQGQQVTYPCRCEGTGKVRESELRPEEQ